jgi:hypothetical protein
LAFYEGLDSSWGGSMAADSPSKFAEEAASLYNDSTLWKASVAAGTLDLATFHTQMSNENLDLKMCRISLLTKLFLVFQEKSS